MKITFDSGNIGKKEVKKLAISCILLLVIFIEFVIISANIVGIYTDPEFSMSYKMIFTLLTSICIYYMFKHGEIIFNSVLKTIALYGVALFVVLLIESFISAFVSVNVDAILDSIMSVESTGKKVVIIAFYIVVFGAFIWNDHKHTVEKGSNTEDVVEEKEKVEETNND